MKSVTKAYLAHIIFRLINKTIKIHRGSQHNFFYHENYPTATDAEILDFIHSIPLFDLPLKNFIVGNLNEETIIISQAWENEFIKRSQAWAESDNWLHYDDCNPSIFHRHNLKKNIALTLPY